MTEQPPITYQLIMEELGISEGRVKGLIRKARITRIATGPRSIAIYPPGTIEALRKLNTMPPLRKSKVSHVVQELGAAGAEEKYRQDEAVRRQAALERRTPSNFPPPPAGQCQHPGCERRAIMGQWCSNPNHYASRGRG